MQPGDRADLRVEALGEELHGCAVERARLLELGAFQLQKAGQHRQVIGHPVIGLVSEGAIQGAPWKAGGPTSQRLKRQDDGSWHHPISQKTRGRPPSTKLAPAGRRRLIHIKTRMERGARPTKGPSIARQAVEEIHDGNIQSVGEAPQAGSGDRDHPGFVFLDLLERDATGQGELGLRQIEETPTGTQPTPDTALQVG
jgi:hypothetical protein